MSGIINWNELWKTTRSGHFYRKNHEDPQSMWDKRAKKFNESAMQHPERAQKQITNLDLKPEYTVLDVGAGTGRLAIPIAKQVRSVTALDQSAGMLACLQENMEKEGITNINCINKSWEDIEVGVDIEAYDIVIACHSLGMFDIREALKKMDTASKKYVYVLSHAGKWMNGMDGRLQKEIFGNRHRHMHPDYILHYNILHDMKIFANVDIQDMEFEQQYKSLDDAVDKWKQMRDIPPDKEDILREYLSDVLKKDEKTGNLCFKHKSKHATIWWQKN